MPRALSSPAAGTPSSPTVSVSEALGLPEDWTMTKALKGEGGTEAPVRQKDEDPLPGEGEGLEGPKEGEEGYVAPVAEGEDAPAEGAPEPEAKPEAKPAAEGKGKKPVVAAKPEAKPAAGAKQVAAAGAKPAVVAKPAVAAAAKPAVAAEAKIKIGDKEFTQKELEEAITKANAVPAVAKPAAVVKKEPTAEEVAARVAEGKKKDAEWIAANAPSMGVAPITDEDMDVILSGGQKGVEKLNTIFRANLASVALMVRKSMFSEIGPVFDQLSARLEPLAAAHLQAEDEKEWTSFSSKYDDLKDNRDLVEQAASVLIEKEPDRVRPMSMEQFQEEVAKQVRTFKGRFVTAAPAAADSIEIEGKVYTKAELAALVAGKPADGSAPGVAVAAAPGAKPGVAAKPRAAVKPPGANVPAATAGAGIKGAKGDSDIISTLW